MFRDAFGVNFDDAVRFGLSAATNLASDAVSSLPSSLSDLAATQRRRASIRMSSNALAIQRRQSQVTEARQDLKAANEQRETAIKDYNRFFKDPQIRMGNLPFCNLFTARYFGSFSLAWMLLGLKQAVTLIIIWETATLIRLFYCYIRVFEESAGILRKRKEQTETMVHLQAKRLEDALHALEQVKSPVNQSLQVAGAFFGILPERDCLSMHPIQRSCFRSFCNSQVYS